jgi:predicted ATP-grasp superfamily ATP-dependent carboligase
MADQKFRKPIMFSNPTVHRSIPLSYVSQAKKSLIKYFQDVKYRGLFMAEFKKDPRDGVFKLLEINARSAGSSYFAVACGMNHVLRAYLDALGEEIHPVTDYESYVYKIHILRDFPLLLNKLVHGNFSIQDIYTYFRKIHWQVFSLDDALPFLAEIHYAIKDKGFRKLMNRARA